MMTFDRGRRALLAAVTVWPAMSWADSRTRAPALLLAHDAPPDQDPRGHLVSEKLDGVRAYWDGQTLRFRSGLPIAAPAWFTRRLPNVTLDGELWMGRGLFEALSGAVRRLHPQDAEWRAIRYMVFELPDGTGTFTERAAALRQIVARTAWDQLIAIEQTRVTTLTDLRRRLDAVVAAGGEGLMLHLSDAPYMTGRSSVLLKLKPLQDADAVVMRHIPGRGRHAGRLGALEVRMADGREFRLGTGFSDAQRVAAPPEGSVVTFTYRGTTESGVPRFASFLRVRDQP